MSSAFEEFLVPVMPPADACVDCSCYFPAGASEGFCQLRGHNVACSKESCAAFNMRRSRKLRWRA